MNFFKNIFFTFLLFVFIFLSFKFLPYNLLADVFFLNSDNHENTQKQVSTNLENQEIDFNCSVINKNNDYLGQDYGFMVESFLKKQDEAFKQKIDEIFENDFNCDFENKRSNVLKVSSMYDFFKERQLDLRKVDCALIDIQNSDEISSICKKYQTLDMVLSCEQNEKSFVIKETRKSLILSMQKAIMSVSEVHIPLSLHRQIECIQKDTSRQKKLFEEFLVIFVMIYDSFVNAATQ